MPKRQKEETKRDLSTVFAIPKAPWYVVALGLFNQWLRARRARKLARIEEAKRLKRWRHVATIWTATRLIGEVKPRIIPQWYILRERGDGTRAFEYGTQSTYYCGGDERSTRHYAQIVAPWMLGKWNDEQMREVETTLRAMVSRWEQEAKETDQ